jgi:hypothetical protein
MSLHDMKCQTSGSTIERTLDAWEPVPETDHIVSRQKHRLDVQEACRQTKRELHGEPWSTIGVKQGGRDRDAAGVLQSCATEITGRKSAEIACGTLYSRDRRAVGTTRVSAQLQDNCAEAGRVSGM